MFDGFGDWGITQDADTALVGTSSNVVDINTGMPVPAATAAAATPAQPDFEYAIGRIRAILGQLKISDEELRKAKAIIERFIAAFQQSGIKDSAAEKSLQGVIQKHVRLANAQVKLNNWIDDAQEALGLLEQTPENEMGIAPLITALYGTGILSGLVVGWKFTSSLQKQAANQTKELQMKEKAYNDALKGKVPWSVWSMIGVDGGDWKTALVKMLPFVAVGGGAYYLWNRFLK